MNSSLFDRSAPHDAREALFGGRAVVRVWNLDPAPLPPFRAVLACELEAGGRVGVHVQQEAAEIVLGVSGEGRAHVNDASQPLIAGAVVQLPLGARLAIDNDSPTEPLRYVIIKAAG